MNPGLGGEEAVEVEGDSGGGGVVVDTTMGDTVEAVTDVQKVATDATGVVAAVGRGPDRRP